MMPLLILKLILTLCVAIALSLPLFYPAMGSGFLQEMQMLGLEGAIVVIIVFLILVFFYCRDLQTTLEYVASQNRTAKPKSVWLMFLVPYNFIEDFFIIYNVATSLKNEALQNNLLKKFNSYGLISGIGWCTAQIISLMPGYIGQLAGLLAIVFWLIHWYFIRSVMQTFASAKKSCSQFI